MGDRSMKYLPIGLSVQARSCLVVGGGKIGSRKVKNLLKAGARVTLISPEASEEMVALADSGKIRWLQEPYHDGHLDGAFLAVTATETEDLNARVVEEAGRLGILVCDASSAHRSQVIFGALHEDEGVTVAVFTDGQKPSRARRTRDQIRAFLTGGPKTPDS
jgi:siroheme synthase-like protein